MYVMREGCHANLQHSEAGVECLSLRAPRSAPPTRCNNHLSTFTTPADFKLNRLETSKITRDVSKYKFSGLIGKSRPALASTVVSYRRDATSSACSSQPLGRDLSRFWGISAGAILGNVGSRWSLLGSPRVGMTGETNIHTTSGIYNRHLSWFGLP